MQWHFNPHTIPALICLILALSCGFFVLFHNPKSALNRIFFFMCIDIAAWMSFDIPFLFNLPDSALVTWFRVSYCFISFLPIMCFTFTTTYLNAPKNIFWYRINSLIGFTFCIMSLTTDWIIKGSLQLPWFPYPKAGIFHILLVLHCSYLALCSLILMIDVVLKKNAPSKSINHLKYLSAGVIMLAFGMWDFLGNYGLKVYPIGPFTCTLFLITVTTAIVKHQLMDINVVIKKGLVYSFLISAITFIYVILVLILERLFFNNYPSHQTLPGFLSVCLMAIIFIPFRNRLHRWLDRVFLKNDPFNIAEENILLRQEIIQTERLKAVSVLASGMAHEIKNPLTAIMTFSEYLPQKLDDKAFLQKFAPIIHNEAKRIDSLVHELLDFAKPAPVQLRPTNICSLIDNTLEFLSSDFLKHKVQIIKNYKIEPAASLLLDANQFKQALLNILLNAVDAMPAGGQLTVNAELSSSKEKSIIKIQDTGCGIASQDIPHIFDPFFSKKDNGTGLGLAITYEIIKNHNGKIFVESNPGTGTTFIIELPYALDF